MKLTVEELTERPSRHPDTYRRVRRRTLDAARTFCCVAVLDLIRERADKIKQPRTSTAMSTLRDVKSYMEFWGWTSGGAPGSVKQDAGGGIIARHGDAVWIEDVQKACDTLDRIAKLAANGS